MRGKSQHTRRVYRKKKLADKLGPTQSDVQTAHQTVTKWTARIHPFKNGQSWYSEFFLFKKKYITDLFVDLTALDCLQLI